MNFNEVNLRAKISLIMLSSGMSPCMFCRRLKDHGSTCHNFFLIMKLALHHLTFHPVAVQEFDVLFYLFDGDNMKDRHDW